MITFTTTLLFGILLAMTSIIVSRAFGEKNSQPIKEINEKLDALLKKFETEKPEIVEVTQLKADITDLPNIIKEWEIVIKTQMHFNDLIMKVRTTTLSVVLAVYGAAGYSFATGNVSSLYFEGLGTFHPAVLIIGAGIFILSAVFVVDNRLDKKILLTRYLGIINSFSPW